MCNLTILPWCMKLDSVLQNETHEILWDFEIQNPGSKIRPSVKNNQKILASRGFCPSGEPQIKKKRKGRQIFSSCPWDENTIKHVVDCDTNCNWGAWNCSKRFLKDKIGGIGNQENQDHPGHSAANISLHTSEEICYHSDSSENPSANAGLKKFAKNNVISL